jgi:hypothetical protein
VSHFYCYAECHYTDGRCSFTLSTTFYSYAECHYTDCHYSFTQSAAFYCYAEYPFSDCQYSLLLSVTFYCYAECHYNDSHYSCLELHVYCYTGCHYTDCRYSECHGTAQISPSSWDHLSLGKIIQSSSFLKRQNCAESPSNDTTSSELEISRLKSIRFFHIAP